jgi:hypothetical protein
VFGPDHIGIVVNGVMAPPDRHDITVVRVRVAVTAITVVVAARVAG